MPKSTKRFILSDDRLNSHKFRVLTAGADLADFKKNPIMYWLHKTPRDKGDDSLLPIGFWDDIEVSNGEITAVPNFDDSDEFAMKLYHKVEHGTIRAASAEVDPVEYDTNKANWAPGQKLPNVSVWKMGEASLCDRGSNPGAVVKMRRDGKTITLSDDVQAAEFFNQISLQEPEKDSMKIKLTKTLSKALKLNEGDELDATDVVDKLVEVIEGHEIKKTELEGEVTKLKNEAVTEKITLMVDKAITDRKILAGQKENFIKLAEGNFETTKALLDGMKGTESLEGKLKDADGADSEEGKLMKLSWDDLHKSNGLVKLKATYPESYKLKFEEKFGHKPTNV
jgi:hypothetical protein